MNLLLRDDEPASDLLLIVCRKAAKTKAGLNTGHVMTDPQPCLQFV